MPVAVIVIGACTLLALMVGAGVLAGWLAVSLIEYEYDK